MSQSLTFPPVTAAAMLWIAEAFGIGDQFQWKGSTPDQEALLRLLPDYFAVLPQLSQSGVVRGFAADTAEAINRELERAGFPDLQLSPWAPSPRVFGAAGISRVSVKWWEPGKRSTVFSPDGRDYVAARLAEGGQLCQVTQTSAWDEPVVAVRGQDDMEVRLVVCPRPESPTHLIEESRRLHGVRLGLRSSYGGADVPMVKLNQRPDVSWLVGLSHDSDEGVWRFVQAVMQTKFGLNEFGAEGREAAAGCMARSSGLATRPFYPVRQPFLLIVTKEDMRVPLLTAWIGQDAWSDPGDLSQIDQW